MSDEKGQGAPRTNADLTFLAALLALCFTGMFALAWLEMRNEYHKELEASAQLKLDHRAVTTALVAMTNEITVLEDAKSINDASCPAGDHLALEAAMNKLEEASRASQRLTQVMTDLATTREALETNHTELVRLQVTSEFLTRRLATLPSRHADRDRLSLEVAANKATVYQLTIDGSETNDRLAMYQEQLSMEKAALETELANARANLSRQLTLAQDTVESFQTPGKQQAVRIVD